MLRFALISSLFYCFSFNIHAQDRDFGISIGLTYTPTDFFVKAACNITDKRFQKSPFLALGINRTFFQQRLYPEIGFQFSYIINDQKIRLLPYAQMSIARLKITNDNAHYWLNNELGIRLEWHNKRDFGIQFGYRNLNEFWSFNKRLDKAFDFGFTTGIYMVL